MPGIPGNKYKSAQDCVDGYHGIRLAEKDRHKTTLATGWGEFRYQRALQGYLSSGDIYRRHHYSPSSISLMDFEKIVDNIITYSETVEVAFQRIYSILSHYNMNGLMFNSEKSRFARRKVEFAGFLKDL